MRIIPVYVAAPERWTIAAMSVSSQTEPRTFPLTMAGEDELVRIQTLRGSKRLGHRLTEMGLNLGTEIRVLQRLGGGLVVARGDTRIAVGGGMAAKILVTEIPR